MRAALSLIPVAVIALAAGAPLYRYYEKGRTEQTAIDTLVSVRQAQDRLQRRTGGYATELNSLTTACGGSAELSSDVIARLERVGYALELRAAEPAAVVGRDCGGRLLGDDYYVAAAPRDSSTPGQQAFGARARGDVFLFYDGVAPRELEMSSGLATPVAQRETFKIP